MESISQCRALNVSDEKRCEETAVSVNGMFCAFHSKQCHGLYRGYKLRNERLDKLNASPPPFLADTKIPLSTQTFEAVESKEVCHEIHDYLFLKLQLLDRVIRARKLHHSRFFSLDMDYGHAKYLDVLQGQKATITKALERLEHRTAEVLYQHEQWFTWVRECQNDEEENREKEQKKVKMEAALFKRHWKAAQQRLKESKAKEDKKRQDAFLEKVYKERLAEQEQETEDSDDTDWDPIEEVLEDNRGSFIDLIQHFLWMSMAEDAPDAKGKEDVETNGVPVAHFEMSDPAQEQNAAIENAKAPASKKSRSKAKKKAAAAKAPAPKANPQSQSAPDELPDKGLIETREEMHERLKYGADITRGQIDGVQIAGTIENPVIETKTITFPDDEIEQLLTQVSEIKHLLFCRLLLGHATLLPAALRANNVLEFLGDPEVSTSALRDICLKMDRPDLQDIRDACADLFRSEDEVDEDTISKMRQIDGDSHAGKKKLLPWKKKRGELPDKWVPNREKQAMGKMLPDVGGSAVDFGEGGDQTKLSRKKIRVKICGRHIWNYPSDRAMNRGGWLQFCILAKDSRLHDAVALCRSWDEFFELNILASWHYFPAANWSEWVGGRYRQQMLQLGFIVYFESVKPDAYDLTVHRQIGARGQGFRRSHMAFEARNFMCAHIKRDDQVSRRLVQYLSMQSHDLLVLVRDAESGKLLITPPEEERWLYREKSGLGRAVKNEWNILKQIGPVFFEEMDRYREWRFTFPEYYDVYVWDLEPGMPFPHLYNTLQRLIFKAHRFTSGKDIYRPAESVLKTLYRDPESHRPRQIKPEDQGQIQSIWDELHNEKSRFMFTQIDMKSGKSSERKEPVLEEPHRNMFYNDADALEDAILFPEEFSSEELNPLAIKIVEPIKKWEEEGFSLSRWVEGLDLVDSDDDDKSSYSGGEWVPNDEILEEGAAGSSGSWSDVDEDSDEEIDFTPLMSVDANTRNLFRMVQKNPNSRKPIASDREGMSEEFFTFMDREKARLFKQVWHRADLEPHAQVRYAEMQEFAKESRNYIIKDLNFAIHPIVQLGVDVMNEFDVDGSDMKDLQKALALIYPFFFPHFLKTKRGQPFKDSLLFNQDERAKHTPDRRSHVSNKYVPKEFWDEFDGHTKSCDKDGDDVLDAFPMQWDIAIRPIIAHLYKSGVLRTRADEYFAGQAFPNTEPNRQKQDLYIDYRIQIPTIRMSPGMQDPHSIPSFTSLCSSFTSKHGSSTRFSILTIWSAPHFYPLMIGPDNHNATAFRALIGRRYIWMFVPKDMPCSEWSIHVTARQRIEPFKRAFGDRVVVKRDKFLVLGKDEEECRLLTVAVAWAIQRKPWRWEVDLWKSFVGVDAKFVEGLKDEWLD